jgi:hypothetical protein
MMMTTMALVSVLRKYRRIGDKSRYPTFRPEKLLSSDEP